MMGRVESTWVAMSRSSCGVLSIVVLLATVFDSGRQQATAQPLLTLQKPTPVANDQFGFSVAGVGSNLAVGAPYDDTGGTDAGAVYVFDGTTGMLLQTLQKAVPVAGDLFGYAVAAVGSNVLVGAPNDDTGATDAGAAYVFDSTGILILTIPNPSPATGDEFGSAVAAVGTNLLVGARSKDAGAVDAGAAYLFNGTTGALMQTFSNPTPALHDLFGYSVAAVGSNILVGAPDDNTGASNAGAAYLFNPSGALLQTFQKPLRAINDQLGWSVAGLGANVAVVGAPFDDTGAKDAGAVYLFDGTTGLLLKTVTNPSPAIQDWFGFSVATLGTNVLVGTRFDDTVTTDAGAAYLFDGATATLLQTFTNPPRLAVSLASRSLQLEPACSPERTSTALSQVMRAPHSCSVSVGTASSKPVRHAIPRSMRRVRACVIRPPWEPAASAWRRRPQRQR